MSYMRIILIASETKKNCITTAIKSEKFEDGKEKKLISGDHYSGARRITCSSLVYAMYITVLGQEKGQCPIMSFS